MTINDLNDIFGLFVQGFVIGGLLSACAFMLGWAINFCLALVKQ